MHYIKDLAEKKATEHAHNKFVRYSKGNFVGPLVNIKISSSAVKIKSSFHCCDELLSIVGQALGAELVHVTGSLIWNSDLSAEFAKHGIKYFKVSKAQGIFKYALDNDVNIKNFSDNMSKYNALLSFKTPTVIYSTKSALPKPNKEIVADFCKVTLPASFKDQILKEYAFDVKAPAKDITITHEIIVDDLELPKTEDFAMARRLAKRKGTLIRKVTIDEQTQETKIPFFI
jgi:hypothetical protein